MGEFYQTKSTNDKKMYIYFSMNAILAPMFVVIIERDYILKNRTALARTEIFPNKYI